MTIIRNSAKCNTCDAELESTHVHDFKTHTCPNKFVAALEWTERGGKHILQEVAPRTQAWNWFVDGGKSYIRRGGSGYTDTAIYAPETT